MKENHEKLCQNSRFHGRDLIPGPPEYEAGVLTTTLHAEPSLDARIVLYRSETGITGLNHTQGMAVN
jgi:hypothetical protein